MLEGQGERTVHGAVERRVRLLGSTCGTLVPRTAVVCVSASFRAPFLKQPLRRPRNSAGWPCAGGGEGRRSFLSTKWPLDGYALVTSARPVGRSDVMRYTAVVAETNLIDFVFFLLDDRAPLTRDPESQP